MNPDGVFDFSVFGPALDELPHWGDLSETEGPREEMACRCCLVAWTGSVAAHACPKCGRAEDNLWHALRDDWMGD